LPTLKPLLLHEKRWDNSSAMRSLLAVLTLAGALSLAACDDSEDSDEPDLSGNPREQVVAVVAAMREAMQDGDGEKACSYMTPEGQGVMVKVAAESGAGTPDTCEDAVVAVRSAASTTVLENDAKNVVTADEVTFYRGGTEAQAASDFRGSMVLRLIEGEWQVDVPFFAD
jgi:hypothetical protein